MSCNNLRVICFHHVSSTCPVSLHVTHRFRMQVTEMLPEYHCGCVSMESSCARRSNDFLWFSRSLQVNLRVLLTVGNEKLNSRIQKKNTIRHQTRLHAIHIGKLHKLFCCISSCVRPGEERAQIKACDFSLEGTTYTHK